MLGKKWTTTRQMSCDLWFKASGHDKEIGQGHDFHDFKVMQDEYFINVDKINPMDERSDTYQMKDYRNMQEEKKPIEWVN